MSSNKVDTKEKYRFFLNPYREHTFTKCPKCDNKTKSKKLPLTIHLERKKILLNLNKTCRYCPFCDLLIAKKHELDFIVMQFLGLTRVRKGEYFVIGTQDKAAYLSGLDKGLIKDNYLEGVSIFKDMWDFTAEPSGWRLPASIIKKMKKA